MSIPDRGRRHCSLGFIVAAALLLVGCTPSTTSRSEGKAAGGPPPPTTTCRVLVSKVRAHPDSASLARVTTVLSEFSTRAWNPDAPAVRPSSLTGGLFVNFQPTWDGGGSLASRNAQTNIQGDGRSDTQTGAAPRHDPLTDLLILRDLDALASTGATDVPAERLRCLLQPVTEAEFASYGPARGWIYQQLIDLSGLDSTGPWLTDARKYAANLSQQFSPGLTGTTVRPEWVAESAAALVDAGTQFSQRAWTDTGRAIALQLCQTSADPVTGLFAGSVAISQAGVAKVEDPLVKVGGQAQLLDALLTVADGTGEATVRSAVAKALLSLQSPQVGVIDTERGGWFYAVDADGKSVRSAYKEARQAWMVPLLDDAARAGLVDASSVTAARGMVRDRLYQPGAAGYSYRVAPDWMPFQSPQHGTALSENWISSEATGIAALALLGGLSDR